MMRRLVVLRAVAALLGIAVASPTAAQAEARTLRVAKQYGIGYLQLMTMQEQKLIEKHATAAGLGDLAVDWATFRSSDVMNDALISGTVDFVCLGITGIITIWSKTKDRIGVKAAAALNVAPLYLNVRDPAIASLADFKETHRIAMPAVKVSMQAILLQMAAARAFGEAKYDALDHLAVSMAHPDATAAMLAGSTDVVANFSSPPFQYRQLKDARIHRLLNSTDLVDGGISFNVIATTAKFRNENPQAYGAFLAALREATAFVNADKRRAAEVYLKASGEKTPFADIAEVLNDPQIVFTTKPLNIQSFVDFMAKVGTLKSPPAAWKEMFFPEALAAAGD